MRVALLSMYRLEEVRGGTEVFVEHLRRAFPELDVITYSSLKRERGLDLTRLNLEEARKGLAISREFLARHRREGYDLVIANSTAGWALGAARPDLPMMNVYHFTLKGLAEGTLRGTPGYLPSRYLSSWFEVAAAWGKRCVAVSPKIARELHGMYGISSRVIENGVPMDLFRPLPRDRAREALGLEGEGEVALFVGRADHTKGFEVVREAARRRPGLRVMCVSPSAIDDQRLIVHRNVPHERMPLYYSAADVLLFPSRYESVGYTALEAMACDLPVVASRTGVFEDLPGDGVGRVVANGEADDYLRALDEVLSGPALHPREAVRERFSMERFAEEYRAAAREAVESYRPRRRAVPSPAWR